MGVCHGVIERIAPGATVIDIAHDLPPADVRHAAFVLENALPFLPAGIVLAVVDPGVGSKRRAVALRSRSGTVLVGPDNGLLWPAAQAAGGVDSAVDVSATPFRLDPVSATFHGRDVFAPVAAHLALGAALEDAGDRASIPRHSCVSRRRRPRWTGRRCGRRCASSTGSATCSCRPVRRTWRGPASRSERV